MFLSNFHSTTTYFLDVTIREAYCLSDEFESFDPVMVKNCKWQQNHAILKEDFLLHMKIGYASYEQDIDHPIQNISMVNETLKHPSPETLYI